MDKNNKFIKNTFVLFVGKFSTQIVSFLLLPLFTFKYTASDYGYIDLIQTYISLFAPVLLLQLDSATFRFLIDVRDNRNEKNILISSSAIFIFMILIFITLLGIIVNIFLNIKYITLIILNVCALILNMYVMSISRGEGNSKDYSISSCISSIVNLFINLVLILIYKYDVSSILIASIVSNVVSIIYLSIKEKIYKKIKFKYFKIATLKKLLKYSLPMIPNVLSWWIIGLSDRTIIVKMLSTGANGLYSVSCKFSNLLNSIFSIFSMSWQETASIHIKDKDADEFFSKIINNIFILFIVLSCGIVGLLPLVYNYIIGKDYINAYNYIPILLIGNLFNVLVGLFGGIYVAKKMTNKVAVTTIYSAIINIILNILFIKKIGLYAACFSTVIAYLSMSIYRYFDIRKYIKIRLYFKEISMYLLAFLLLLIPYFFRIELLSIVLLLMICLIYLRYNKNMLLLIIKKMRKKLKPRNC